MTTSIVKSAPHRCVLPSPIEGEVRRCDQCGRYWLGQQPPNVNFWRWVRLGPIRRWLRGVAS